MNFVVSASQSHPNIRHRLDEIRRSISTELDVVKDSVISAFPNRPEKSISNYLSVSLPLRCVTVIAHPIEEVCQV